jgi:integration host factor subunit beta
MVKKELAVLLSQKKGISKKEAEIAIKTVFESIVDSLSKGEKVELRGFGSFRIKDRKPRKSRNPKTGETVDVPAKKVPFFRAGKDLKIVG